MPESQRDYFAEMYVAGLFGDCGWNVYFPRRDNGFDFIVSKMIGENTIIRPVQVKGKFPEENRRNQTVYGFMGELSQLHKDMVLAIPFFPTDRHGHSPVCTAFMPRDKINVQQSQGWACRPGCFRDGNPRPRRDFAKYFDRRGIEAIEQPDWA